MLCPAAAFAGAAGALAALAAVACKELPGARALPSLLLLHLDSVSGALTLREAGFGQLRPAELRVAGVTDQLVTLQSRCGRGAAAGQALSWRAPRALHGMPFPTGRCLVPGWAHRGMLWAVRSALASLWS